MARTKYQSLVAAVGSKCSGRGTAATVAKRKKAYIDNAIKKGKTRAEAMKIANKATSKKCPVSVSATKKRKKTYRKK